MGSIVSTAEAAARHGVAVEPDDSEARRFVAAVDFWLGRVDEAIAESRRSVALSPRAIDAIAHDSRILAMAGREAEALVLLQPLQALRPKVRRVSEAVASVCGERRMSGAMPSSKPATVRSAFARILAESGRAVRRPARFSEVSRRDGTSVAVGRGMWQASSSACTSTTARSPGSIARSMTSLFGTTSSRRASPRRGRTQRFGEYDAEGRSAGTALEELSLRTAESQRQARGWGGRIFVGRQ